MGLSDRIKSLREITDLTQEEFGKRIGYGRAHISMLESGSRKPTDRTVEDICRVYGVNKEWLLHGTGEMRRDETLFIKAAMQSLGELEPEEEEIMKNYLAMPPEKRLALIRLLDELFEHKKR